MVSRREMLRVTNRYLQARNLGRDIVGSPLQLRVYHTFTLTQGGKVSGTASGLLAAGTLGLVPQVYSGEHAMVYELVVNGAVLTSYTYHRILTRTHNLWSADATHGLGKEGQAWAESTVNEFLHDCAADPKLAELMAEYHYYFEAAH
jgi:hypothetical protein